MTEDDIKLYREIIGKDPNGNVPISLLSKLMNAFLDLRKEKVQLVGELLAVTNCGFCSLCRERHGK